MWRVICRRSPRGGGARGGGAGERELLGHGPEDPLGEVLRRLLLEELGAELRDAGVVDPRLQLGVRVDRTGPLGGLVALRRGVARVVGLGGRAVAVPAADAIVEAHRL